MGAAERFWRFVEWTELPEVEVGRRGGYDPSYTSKIVKGRRHPGLVVAFAIEDLTTKFVNERGERWPEPPISAREWTEEPEAESSTTPAPAGTEAV